MTNFAVVDAQGHYGTYTRVRAVFEILDEADAYAQRGACAVLAGAYELGEQVHRLDAERAERRADGARTDQREQRAREAQERARHAEFHRSENELCRGLEDYATRRRLGRLP